MFFKFALIFAVGTIAGFINTNAGGGSLLTLPALIFMGLPSAVANGTNRIAVLVGALSATATFKQKGIFNWKFGLGLAIPAIIGAVIGTHLVVSMPDRIFNMVLSAAMLVVLTVIIAQPRLKKIKFEGELTAKKRIATMVTFFFVGLYGGAIQAGVGFVIIAVLTLITGLSLVRINALKVFVVLVYVVFSIAIFAARGKIDIVMGIVLSAGSALGAYLGSNFAVKKGDKWIRVVLVIAVLAMAVKLSGILDFLWR